jgi:hypothetical protein
LECEASTPPLRTSCRNSRAVPSACPRSSPPILPPSRRTAGLRPRLLLPALGRNGVAKKSLPCALAASSCWTAGPDGSSICRRRELRSGNRCGALAGLRNLSSLTLARRASTDRVTLHERRLLRESVAPLPGFLRQFLRDLQVSLCPLACHTEVIELDAGVRRPNLQSF